MRQLSILLLLLLLPAVSRPEDPPSAATVAPEALQSAIGRLGAAAFREREAAQRELLALADRDHAAVLDACLRAAVIEQDVEVAHRLEELLLQVVDRKIYDAPKGFLGIRLMKDTLLRDGKEVHVILASEVLPNTGAAAAGVVSGDVIISCDGQPIPADPTTMTFIQYIQSHPPGSVVNIEVLREDKAVKIPVTLGGRPAEARGFSLRQELSLDAFFEQWRFREHRRLGLPPP
jgi:predicted metalloprotease with PDZ domain